MSRCEHSRIYSGATNLERKFQWICMACGEIGWSETYEVSMVDLDAFYRVRLSHGWPSTGRLPPPPRLPTKVKVHVPRETTASNFAAPMLMFAALFAICGLSGIRWPHGESAMPMWLSLVLSGCSLMMFTVCYIAWKKGH